MKQQQQRRIRLKNEIVNKIIEFAWYNTDYCNCVEKDYLKRLKQTYIDDETLISQIQLIECTQRYYRSCPLHSIYNTDEYFGAITNVNNRIIIHQTNIDRLRWRLKLSTISKQVRQFIKSNLFNNIIFQPNLERPRDIKKHLNHTHNLIRNIRSLSISIQSLKNLFGDAEAGASTMIKLDNCEKLEIIHDPVANQSVTTIPINLPKLRSLTINGILKDRSVLPKIVSSHPLLYSINLINVETTQPVIEHLLTCTATIKKLLLPFQFSNLLLKYKAPNSIRQTLEAIFIAIDKSGNRDLTHLHQQFPKLNHIYLDVDHHQGTTVQLPSTITSITTNTSSIPTYSFFQTNKSITRMKIKEDNWDKKKMFCNNNSLETIISHLPDQFHSLNIDTILIENNNNIKESDEELLARKGLQFTFSKNHTGHKTKRTIYLKMITTPLPNQTYQFLPNTIIYQILEECWYGYRSLCACRLRGLILNCDVQYRLNEYKEEVVQCQKHNKTLDTPHIQNSRTMVKQYQLELMLISSSITRHLRANVLHSMTFNNTYQDGYHLLDKCTFYLNQPFKPRPPSSEIVESLAPAIKRFLGFHFPFSSKPTDPHFPHQITHISLYSRSVPIDYSPIYSYTTLVSIDLSQIGYSCQPFLPEIAKLESLKKLLLSRDNQHLYELLPQSTKNNIQVMFLDLIDSRIDRYEILLLQFPQLKCLRGNLSLRIQLPPSIKKLTCVTYDPGEIYRKIVHWNCGIKIVKFQSSEHSFEYFDDNSSRIYKYLDLRGKKCLNLEKIIVLDRGFPTILNRSDDGEDFYYVGHCTTFPDNYTKYIFKTKLEFGFQNTWFQEI